MCGLPNRVLGYEQQEVLFGQVPDEGLPEAGSEMIVFGVCIFAALLAMLFWKQ